MKRLFAVVALSATLLTTVAIAQVAAPPASVAPVPFDPFASLPSAAGRAPSSKPVRLAVNAQGRPTLMSFPCAYDATPSVIQQPISGNPTQMFVGLALRFTDPACRRASYTLGVEFSVDDGKTWLVPQHARSGVTLYQTQAATTTFRTDRRRHVVRFLLSSAELAAVLGPYVFDL